MPRMTAAFAALGLAFGAALSASAQQGEDVGRAPAFQEGDVIAFDQLDKLRPFLPPEFWANRDFFFYEGMQLEIGPSYRDYSPPSVFAEATRRQRGKAKLGPEGSLENYTAGQPFEQIDCRGDPQAATKIMWNFDYRWTGDGRAQNFYYSYWDRGEELPLYYEGSSRVVQLANRVEPEYQEQGGDLFRGEKRKFAYGIDVAAPFDARGIQVMSYRYKAADKPRAETKNDDTWVYVPTLRRVRRISTAQRTDAVSGTDFTFDDLFSFFGIVPQYEWQCLAADMDILAPMNTKVLAFPYEKDHNFGPYGLSYADDRWELRKAFKVRFFPRNKDHPYHHKDIYIDSQTYESLYSFAYDRKEELWKIIWHNHRWSEDTLGSESPRQYYAGWEGVPEPRDLRIISDTIANVQTGTGNRIEFWNGNGAPIPSKGRVRRYIDVGRLTKGR